MIINKHGRYTFYFEDNVTPKYICDYENNILDGEFKEYFRNGNLCMECVYVDGVIDGLCSLYNEDGTLSVHYRYEMGSIVDETSYYPNQNVCTESNLIDEDDLVIDDNISVPPLGELLYINNDDTNPTEIYPGTLWELIHTAIKTSEEDGTDVNKVYVWIRLPKESNGPFVYINGFKEYHQDGELWRVGEYSRMMNSDLKKYITVLHSDDKYTLSGSIKLFDQKWNLGLLDGNVNFYDDISRIWKNVTYQNGKRIAGYYNVYDLGYNMKLEYTFSPSEVAKLTIHV